MKSISILAMIVVAATGLAQAEPSSNSAAYPLSTCIVTGETLGGHGKPITLTVDGREIRLCCSNCVPTFEEDRAGWLAKIDAEIIESQAATYPLESCVISGEKLGGMGAPVDQLVGNRLVRLCCSNCVAQLQAEPAAAVAKLDAAVVAAQSPDYAASDCPVSGQPLGAMGEPVNLVFDGKLVKLCCPNCVEGFYADPVKALASLHGESAEQHGEQAEDHSAHKH